MVKSSNNHKSSLRATILMMLIICGLVNLTLSTTFHLQKSIKLPSLNNVVKVTALENNTIAVQSTANAAATVTILRGTNFETKVSEFTANVDHSQIQITSKGVFVNDGTSLTEKVFKEENTTLTGFTSKSNMVTTPNYALFVTKSEALPTLTKINFSTMKQQLVTYDVVEGWNTSSQNYVKNMGNGKILFGMGYSLFIVDSQTLKPNQIVSRGESNHSLQVLRISSFVDDDAKTSTILFQRDRIPDLMSKYTLLKLNAQTQKYVESDSFYTEAFSPQIVQTSLTTGVSIRYHYEVYRWDNFHSILSQSYDEDDALRDRDYLALSYSQTFIVMSDKKGSFEFYDVAQDLKITLKGAAQGVSTDQVVKGALTNDDLSLFVSTQDKNNSKFNIFKIDTSQYTSEIIKDQTGSQDNNIDFHLLDTKYKQFITLANGEAGTYKINLVNLDDLSVVDTFKLDAGFFTDFAVRDAKLVASIDLGLKFAVAAQNKAATQGNNDSFVYLFQVSQNKIVSLNLKTPGNYTTLRACSTYLINYLAQNRVFTFQKFDDFTTAKRIDTDDVELDFYIQKNVLILSSRFYSYKQVFDLSKSVDSLGMFYIDHYMYRQPYYNYIAFPNRKIYLSIAQTIRYEVPTRAYYSFLPTTLSRIDRIENSQKQYDGQTYLVYKQNGVQCNLVFYIQYDDAQFNKTVWYIGATLVRYSECDQKSVRIPLEAKTKLAFTKLWISTDKKYVITGLKNNISNEFFLEVRLVSDVTKVIANQKINITPNTDRYDIFDVDVVQDGLIVIHEEQKVTIIDLERHSSADSFGLASITAFDVNSNGVSALAGPSLTDQTKFGIVAKNGDTKIFDQSTTKIVKNIAVSQTGQHVAVVTDDSFVIVWHIDAQVYSQEHVGVTKIKFVSQTKLLIQSADSYKVITVDAAQEQEGIIGQSNAGSYDVQTSSDGALTAVATDKTVSIYENNVFLVNYTLPTSSETIKSVSFSPQNNIVIVSDASKVYVLSSLPCPSTYTLDNFNCVCPADKYAISGVCQECSFPCKACEGSTSSCTEYSAGYYVLIIGGVLLVVALAVGGFIFYRRKKMKNGGNSLLNYEEQEKSLKSIKDDS